MFDRLKRLFSRADIEARSMGGYTGLVMDGRAEAISLGRAAADLSGVVQGCAALWANGLALAETDAGLLTPAILSDIGRGLALTGNSVWLITDAGLVPASTFDVTTRNGWPVAYRLDIPDTGGSRSQTALAGEVLHLRIGGNHAAPWRGISPLARSSLSGALLYATESALSEVYENAPIGSKIAGMPETAEGENGRLARSFRGKRGRVLLKDSTAVMAGGGTEPGSDWRPADMSPQIRDSMLVESMREARAAVMHSFGILPALMNDQAAGPVIREAERHLAQWTLEPIGRTLQSEYRRKVNPSASIDVTAGVHAFDVGGRARALGAIVKALAEAKATGVDPAQVAAAAGVVGLEGVADGDE